MWSVAACSDLVGRGKVLWGMVRIFYPDTFYGI